MSGNGLTNRPARRQKLQRNPTDGGFLATRSVPGRDGVSVMVGSPFPHSDDARNEIEMEP
jgi:hypothetical protein